MRAVVTGASTGIGRATAEALLRRGWNVIAVSRDPERSRLAESGLRQAGGEIEMVRCDLSRQAEIRRLAGELARGGRIDVLIHCAGALYGKRRETDEGREMTFALGHLAPFLLTYLLREQLFTSTPARIISVSSILHRKGTIDFEDIDARRRYSPLKAYAQAKLANLLFTFELARRYRAPINAVHPGNVYTNASRHSGLFVRALYQLIAPLFFLSPEKGADTIVWAASSDEAATHSGELLHRRKIMTPAPLSRDVELARKLWALSEELTGIRWD